MLTAAVAQAAGYAAIVLVALVTINAIAQAVKK